jgi:hypothetical protein
MEELSKEDQEVQGRIRNIREGNNCSIGMIKLFIVTNGRHTATKRKSCNQEKSRYNKKKL